MSTEPADPRQRPRRGFAKWFRSVPPSPAPREYHTSVVRHRHDAAEVVAVLLDADNIPPSKAGAIVASAAQHGSLRIVRAYGDFFKPCLAGWRHAMTAHAILPRQVTTVARGKDTVDHAIVADAIALAHTTDVTTVVIASSDSDFVDLALQLREIGCSVHGYGERKTLTAMISAYDEFVYLEDLAAPTPVAPASKAASADKSAAINNSAVIKTKGKNKTAKPKAAPKPAQCAGLTDEVAAALCDVVGALDKSPHGADLGAVCHRLHAKGITAKLPENARNKPGRFLKECGLFDVQVLALEAGRSKHTYLRVKPSRAGR